MKKTYFAASSLASLVMLGAGTQAHAADASAAAADTAASSATGLTEVVVTARRRSESAERVPTSVVALSGEALVKQGIHTDTDLQLAVPGLVVVTADVSNTLTFVIRGESLDAYSGSAPGVQPYVNEIPITATTPSVIYDMENVQVLKGPQGTLFGRNSTGGAVLYTTTKPGNEYGGYASFQYGNLNKLIAEAAVNLPIVQDKVLLRLAANFQNGGAFVKNLYDDKYYGDKDGGSYRATLLLKPTDKLTNTTTVQFTNLYGNTTPDTLFYVVPCGQPNGSHTCYFNPGAPIFNELIKPGQTLFTSEPYPAGYVFPGGMAALPKFLKSFGNYVVDENGPLIYNSNAQFIGNTTAYDLTPNLTVKNSFGYQRTSLKSTYDNDGTPYPGLQFGGNPPGGSNVETPVDTVISDELQLQGKAFDSRLTYIVGFFFNDEKDHFNSPLTGLSLTPYPVGGMSGQTCVPTSPTNCAFAPFNFTIRYNQIAEDRSFAGFTQATYAITNKLNLTGGIRISHDTLSSIQGPGSVFYNFNGRGDEYQTTSETQPSWTVSLDYHLTPEEMVYIATRGSWRTGGYEPPAPPLGNTVSAAVGGNYFLPETIRDVEVGSKYSGRVGALPVQFNIDYFYAWIDNVQKSLDTVIAGNISSATVDVPSSTVQGVETDFQMRPTSWLRLGGNFAWIDAEFTTKETLLFNEPADLGYFADTPRYAGSVSADATLPLKGNYGTLDYHFDAYHQSGMYESSVSSAFTPHSELPEYTVFNMRVDWVNPVGAKGLTASVFVKNLTNKLYYTGGTAAAADDSEEGANYGLPRTFGGILRFEF